MNLVCKVIDVLFLIWFLIFGCFLGGLWGYVIVGWLEDLSFIIKQVVVIIFYFGVLVEQVVCEVSEFLEFVIQQMVLLDMVILLNKFGLLCIDVEILFMVSGVELLQVWDELCNCVVDVGV